MVTKELVERCLSYIKDASEAEDGGDYILGAIELSRELKAAEQDVEEGFPPELSRAVVASSGAGDWGVVLWYEGPDLEREIEEVGQGLGVDDLGLFDAPEGISVWEGRYLSKGSELEADGTFRDPTEEEWAAIRDCESPWG